MLKTIAGLQGVTVLSKEAQKKVTGKKGGCGVYLEGMGGWVPVNDTNNDGATLDQVEDLRKHYPGIRWCCDSCSWNQPVYYYDRSGSQLRALVN
jgi:hypothetical protein